MPRTKTIKIAGLNIVSQPHSPQKYVDIFEKIESMNTSVAVYGDSCLRLVHIAPIDGINLINGIKGQILKYSHIGDDSTWVNVDKGATLDSDQIPNLPQGTHPNGMFFDFVFYPKHKINNHKFLYICQFRDSAKKKSCSLSPNHLKKFFETLFAKPDFAQKFDSLEVTVIPSHSALDKVLSLSVVKKLEIFIKAPNPDDLADIESNMLDRMEAINVSEIKDTYKYDGDSIEPDEDIMNDARVAMNNGYVRTEGKNEQGKTEKRSTVDVPLMDPILVEADKPDAARVALQEYQLLND